MKNPLVLVQGEDIQLFKSRADLETYLEPRDVLTGEGSVFDAEGRRLDMTLEEGRLVVVRQAEQEPLHAARLTALLRHALHAMQIETQKDESLEQVIRKAGPLVTVNPTGGWAALRQLFRTPRVDLATFLSDAEVARCLDAWLKPCLDSGLLSGSTEILRDGAVIKLTLEPSTPNAARIVLKWDAGMTDSIYAALGAKTVLEVPVTGLRYTGLVGMEELRALLDAVIMGKFSELIWAYRGSHVKVIGRFDISARQISVCKTSSSRVFLLPFCRRETRRYMALGCELSETRP